MVNLKDVIKEIKKINSLKLLSNEPLKNHTTFHIGGPAKALVIPKDVHALQNVLQVSQGVKKYIIGNGSDLIMPDKGLNGIVIKIAGGMKRFEVNGRSVTIGAGNMLQPMIRDLAKSGLSGLEFASWIPAAFGGAVFMNMGAFDQEIGSLVEYVEIMRPSGNIEKLSKGELSFTYRKSGLKNCIILSAVLKMSYAAPDMIVNRMNDYIAKRKQTQPVAVPCGGSVFRNPKEVPAGKLLDMAGCKGMRIGGAEVSRKHANFIINLGDASSKDVLTLVNKIKKIVKEKFQVSLELELVDSGRLNMIF